MKHYIVGKIEQEHYPRIAKLNAGIMCSQKFQIQFSKNPDILISIDIDYLIPINSIYIDRSEMRFTGNEFYEEFK